MVFQSIFFTSQPNEQISACASVDSGHIMLGFNDRGEHISIIQGALFTLMPSSQISTLEIETMTYGQTTANAVLQYKSRPNRVILGSGQISPDNIIGKKTITQMDADMHTLEKQNQAIPASQPSSSNIKNVTIWINAFIASVVKNADGTDYSFVIATGPHKGATAIPGPSRMAIPSFDDCYLTDQRSFDSNPNASSRIHTLATVDFSSNTPVLNQADSFGATIDTVRIRESTGDELNRGRGVARGKFQAHSGFAQNSTVVEVSFQFAGSNPIAKRPSLTSPLTPTPDDPNVPSNINPDIDYKGNFKIDIFNRKLTLNIWVDGFPFFEGYVSVDGVTKKIFEESPVSGITPATGLAGGANRLIQIDVNL
jgi:hypothetical protein